MCKTHDIIIFNTFYTHNPQSYPQKYMSHVTMFVELVHNYTIFVVDILLI